MKITNKNSMAVVVDIQQKLMLYINEHEQLIKNLEILIDGLNLLKVPFILHEQYPKGLGKTIPQVKSRLEELEPIEKTSFSCLGSEQSKNQILNSKKKIAIVFGTETHICVLQTCLDLLAYDMQVVLVADCSGSRKDLDHQMAIKRLEKAGVIITTYESLLFEICESSENSKFKELSSLIK